MRMMVAPRDTSLPDGLEMFVRPSLGRAIAHHHHHMVLESEQAGEEGCINTVRSMPISYSSDILQPLVEF